MRDVSGNWLVLVEPKAYTPGGFDPTAPWADTTRIVARADSHAQVAELRRRPVGEVLIFGSHILWNNLLTGGLVAEQPLMVGPAVLRGGTPAFGTSDQVPFAAARLPHPGRLAARPDSLRLGTIQVSVELIAVGAVIFDADGRVFVIQRSPTRRLLPAAGTFPAGTSGR